MFLERELNFQLLLYQVPVYQLSSKGWDEIKMPNYEK